jgi:hypothetical protein
MASCTEKRGSKKMVTKNTTPYPVCKNSIKCLDNTGGMPPFRRLNLISNGCRRCSALRLNLANWSEPASRKSFLEFAAKRYMIKVAIFGTNCIPRYRIIRMIVTFKSTEKPLTIFLALFSRYNVQRR